MQPIDRLASKAQFLGDKYNRFNVRTDPKPVLGIADDIFGRKYVSMAQLS